MIKNKEILEIIEKKKYEKSCDNCKHCDLNKYHSGKWYCKKYIVTDNLPQNEYCFESVN